MASRTVGTGLIAWLVAGLLVIGAWPPAMEAAAHEPSQPGSASDARVRLDLKPDQREAIKLTMREHLETLEAIVAALGRQDYRKAADIAHLELGFPKHHEAMQREQGAALPKRYQELAIEHHQAAETLAEAIATHEMTPILRQLENTIRACTACHKAYRL
ncbi:MAG: cytochrome c [Nitrospirae bacterium]|nr:cytochrome c [Nitrospirota bacterium]